MREGSWPMGFPIPAAKIGHLEKLSYCDYRCIFNFNRRPKNVSGACLWMPFGQRRTPETLQLPHTLPQYISRSLPMGTVKWPLGKWQLAVKTIHTRELLGFCHPMSETKAAWYTEQLFLTKAACLSRSVQGKRAFTQLVIYHAGMVGLLGQPSGEARPVWLKIFNRV